MVVCVCEGRGGKEGEVIDRIIFIYFLRYELCRESFRTNAIALYLKLEA